MLGMVLDSLRVAFVLPYPVVLDSLEVILMILYPVTVIPSRIVGNFGARLVVMFTLFLVVVALVVLVIEVWCCCRCFVLPIASCWA
ncbi:unnamed protein product, partial [Symbiodinium necroappetens]